MATTNFYPDNDGDIYANSTVWATVHGATTGTLTAGATDGYPYARKNGANYLIGRVFFNIDTSALPDSCTISSASVGLKGAGTKIGTGTSHTYNVFSSTHSDPIVAGDFDLGGTTAYSDSPITHDDISSSAYNTWSLNATGIAAISKTADTKLCIREVDHDVANSAPTLDLYWNHYLIAQAGTSSDPYLSVSYSDASTSNFFQFF